MDDKELFNAAMNDESVQDDATEQHTEQAEAEQVAEQASDDGQQRDRDEHGRFVAQQKQPDAAKQDEAHVPSWRLREEREQREAAERRHQEAQASFQRQIAELQARLPKAETPRPDIFENPDAFVQQATQQQLDPVRSEIGRLREFYSQRDAIKEHGMEKVQAAYKAIEDGLSRRDPETVAAYNRAMQSMDPYGTIVGWHQQREVYSQIGNDPGAWFEKELEKRMSDPQFAAQQLQRIQQSTQQSSAAKQAPNRVALPPSLSRMSSAQVATDDGDMTDASLFANAMR